MIEKKEFIEVIKTEWFNGLLCGILVSLTTVSITTGKGAAAICFIIAIAATLFMGAGAESEKDK